MEHSIDLSWSPPPDHLDLPDRDVHAWLGRLDIDYEIGERDQPSVLSEGEQERAARFVFDADRVRYVRAHTQLRRLLGRYLRIPPGDVAIVESETGKPALVDDSALWFNMSHTTTFVLFGFTRYGPLGVDVEHVRSSVDLPSLAERFFTPAESKLITSSNAESQLHYFFTAWVRKEAVLKAVGQGLGIPLSAIDVSPDNPASELSLSLADSPPSTWQVINLPAPAQHLAALAIATSPSRVRCFEVRSP